MELVYGLKVSKGGRSPTTKVIFRNLSTPEKNIHLLEMDWLSLPRLTPGRIFTKSPHTSNGQSSGKNFWLEISPNQQIKVLTLKDAQIQLDKEDLLKAFQKDPLLSHTKVFHWIDANGFECWLPVMEMLRKMFIRSPEMARAIIMYDGWHELVKEHSLHANTLNIDFTDRPKKGDIPILSLIASKPILHNCWKSVVLHLPKATEETTIDLSWPFDEPISIQATGKKGDSYFWLQEILDIRGYSIPFERIVPSHPNYIKYKQEGDPRQHNNRKEDGLTDTSESSNDPEPSSEDLILDTSPSYISRPKKYIHIQSTSLSDLDNIIISPEFIEKKEPPTINSNISTQPQTAEPDQSVGKHGHLTDSVSSRYPSTDNESFGVGVKDTDGLPSWGGLECFVKAINHANIILGSESSLYWLKIGTSLIKPKDCGSRWFLKMNDGRDRPWCFACITLKKKNFYFVEVGRDAKGNKLSLSTLFIQNKVPIEEVETWIEKMIENNGHWEKALINQGCINFQSLPHKQTNSFKAWGAYLVKKIQHRNNANKHP